MPESELFWAQLLDYIEGGNVVPVVGEALLKLELNGRAGFLYPYLARALAGELGLPADGEIAEPSLNEIACRYLERPSARREDIYSALHRFLSGQDLPIPDPLAKLAEIRCFKLFVTTTFDPLLARALGTDDVWAYFPNARDRDLPEGWAPSETPVVFHLLGRLSPEPSYAVTEEDVLECLHALQSESRCPKQLLDHLGQAHLLILGCRFENWLARFFLRTTSNDRLLNAEGIDYLADSKAVEDRRLVRFLRAFSRSTEIFEQGDAIEFVVELHRRWLERHPDGECLHNRTTPTPAYPQVRPGTVFLSYAREDLDVAKELHEALEREEVDVWLDQERLEFGEHWEQGIQRQLEDCAYFLPIVSADSLSRERRYLYREWRLAEQEATLRRPNSKFILPLAISRISLDGRDIPTSFQDAQWRHFEPGAEAADRAAELKVLAKEVKTLVRDYHRRRKGIDR